MSAPIDDVPGRWVRRGVFKREDIKKTTDIPFWTKMKLARQPSYYSFDAGAGDEKSVIVRYKILNGKIYILKIRELEKSHA